MRRDMSKTVCKYCGNIHDISMPMCDSCLEEERIGKPDLKEMLKDKVVSKNEYFMIWQPLEVNNAPMYCLSYLDKFDYNSHILYCPDLEELEREMEKRTNAINGLVQLSLF